MDCLDNLSENAPQWKEVDEDYLMEYFVSDPPMTKEERAMVHIDPSKIHFVQSPFDRFYYKEKYPLLEDSVCLLLEQCSIDKTKTPPSTPPPPQDTESKIRGVVFYKDNRVINFD